MSTPRPGRRVRGSTTGRPVMAALDLFGRRWTMRIMWELSHQPLGFRALQARCDGMSSSVLSARLTELLEALLVEQDPRDSTYRLTALGRDAGGALGSLVQWSETWQAALDGGPQRGRH